MSAGNGFSYRHRPRTRRRRIYPVVLRFGNGEPETLDVPEAITKPPGDVLDTIREIRRAIETAVPVPVGGIWHVSVEREPERMTMYCGHLQDRRHMCVHARIRADFGDPTEVAFERMGGGPGCPRLADSEDPFIASSMILATVTAWVADADGLRTEA